MLIAFKVLISTSCTTKKIMFEIVHYSTAEEAQVKLDLFVLHFSCNEELLGRIEVLFSVSLKRQQCQRYRLLHVVLVYECQCNIYSNNLKCGKCISNPNYILLS